MGCFTQLTYQVVFATKYRCSTITDTIQERLYEYIGGTIRAKKGNLIEIGGVKDHVHILARLSPAIAMLAAMLPPLRGLLLRKKRTP